MVRVFQLGDHRNGRRVFFFWFFLLLLPFQRSACKYSEFRTETQARNQAAC